MKASDLRSLFRRRGVTCLGPLAAVSLAVLAPAFLQEAPSYTSSPELSSTWTAPFSWEAPRSILTWQRFDLLLSDTLRTHDYVDGPSRSLYKACPRITLSLGWIPQPVPKAFAESDY